jgi:hypothetical protein
LYNTRILKKENNVHPLWIYILGTLFFFYGCKTTSPNAGIPLAPGAMDIPLQSAIPTGDLNKVLTVDLLTVIPIVYQGNTWPQLTFQRSSQSEYIRYKACSQNQPDQCITGNYITANEVVITGLPAGVIDISVYACVRPSLSDPPISNACGNAKQTIFLQPEQASQDLDSQLAVRNQVEQSILGYGQNLYNALQSFDNNYKNCSDSSITGFISPAVLSQYLALGPALIGAALEDPAAQIISQTGGDGTLVFDISTSSTPLAPTAVPGNAADSSSGESSKTSIISKIGGGIFVTALVLYGVKQLVFPKVSGEAAVTRANEARDMKLRTAPSPSSEGFLRRNPGLLGIGGFGIINAIFGAATGQDSILFGLAGDAPMSAACTACNEAKKAILAINTQVDPLRVQLQNLNLSIQQLTNQAATATP